MKKRTAKFNRFNSDRLVRLGASWRKPKGIDNPLRRRFLGMPTAPKIGFRTNKKHRHLLPNGFFGFRVQNVKELDLLLMHNRTYAAEIGHSVGAKTRAAILKRAAELNVRVTNAAARLRTEESA